MNIFILDLDHEKNSKLYCDKHIVKMITETAQLLSSAFYFTNEEDKSPYRLTHKNHPCSIWVRKSLDNWLWLQELGIQLYIEYQHRYGNKQHKAGEAILNMSVPNLDCNGFSEPPKCMPDEYKTDDLVESYRNYYRNDKIKIATYKNRNVPSFMLCGFDR